MKTNKPCFENWDKMTLTEQGRFCQSCQTTIIDFTNKSPSEVRSLVQQQKVPFCGRITQNQVDYYNATQQNSSNFCFRKWSLAAALSILMYGQQVYAEPTIPLEISFVLTENKSFIELPVIVQDSVPKKVQGVIITGKVVDIKTAAPVPFATVRLEGSSRFETKTDADGYYKLVLPKLNEKVTLEIFSLSYDFKTIQITPSKDIKGLVISLKEMENVYIGIITD